MLSTLRRLIRRINIFGVEIEFHPPPPLVPSEMPPLPAASTRIPASPPTTVSQAGDTVTIVGTSPNRRTPRELDIRRTGELLTLAMHPPGKGGGKSITIPADSVGQPFRSGSITVDQTGTNQQLHLTLHEAEPTDVGERAVRIQIGLVDNQWWMYCSVEELRAAFAALGVVLGK